MKIWRADLAAKTAEITDGSGLSLGEALALSQHGDSIDFDAALSSSTSNLSSTLVVTNSMTIDGDINGNKVADIMISGDSLGNDAATTDDIGNAITDVDTNWNASDNVRVMYLTNE